MNRPVTIDNVKRLPWLAAILLLAVGRLLSPAGFMPEWNGGALALRPCDGIVAAPMAHHGQHHQPKQPAHQQSCPYAVAAGHFGIASPEPPQIEPQVLAAGLAPSAVVRRAAAQSQRERPRSRGPPPIA